MRIRISPIRAWLFLLVIPALSISLVSVTAGNPFCGLQYLTQMAARGIAEWESKLATAFNQNLGELATTTRAKWAAITDSEARRLQALEDCRNSIARAEQVSGGAVGLETAKTYGDA